MEIEPAAIPEHTCPPVIDLQTADTKQLEPISTVATRESETFELRVAEEESFAEPAQAEFLTVLPPRESAQVKFDDEGVLDLGDIDGFSAATSEDDFVLDVEVEPVTIFSAPIAPVTEQAPIESDRPEIPQEFSDAPENSFATVNEPVLTRVTDEPADEVSAAPPFEPCK